LIYESKYARNFKGLGQIKNIPKVLIQIDYAIGIPNYRGFAKLKTINNLIRQNKPDLIFVTSMSNVNEIKKNFNMDKVFMLPFSVDINVYKNTNSKRIIDSMAVYSTHNHVYPNRKRVQGVIKKMGIRSFTKTVIHNAYIRKLNESKMFIISNNVNKRLSMKYTEAMACGALVLADEPEDLKVQGFKRNEHLIIYNGMNDLKEKIQYYLKNSKERNRIAQNGMKFVRSNHSCAKRVRQFTKIVKRELNI
jgi:spore maturation protein CgeB